MTTARQRLSSRRQSEVADLTRQYGIEPPRGWDRMSRSAQLDHIATRILAQSRTTTSLNAMKEEGVLSVSQYNRRVAREIYSQQGTLEHNPPERGVFGRTFVKKVAKPRSDNY